MKFVPVNRPLVTDADISAVVAQLSDGWVSGEAPVVADFEAAMAETCDRAYGVGVSSGSAALDLVFHGLELQPGDEVIVPSFAIISCIAQILRAGAKPVFVDSFNDTWNMRVDHVAERIGPRTRAILAVHTYGLPVDMDPLIATATKHGVPVIEDAAESHGLLYRGRPCGSFGLASIFSFYANKNVTSGEGGMVLTDDEATVARLRLHRNLGFRPERRFVHDELGWNARLSAIQSALGLSQLSRLDASIRRRRQIAAMYDLALADLESIRLPVNSCPYGENDYWVYGVVVDDADRDVTAIRQLLRERGIDTRPFFWPLHEQPLLGTYGLVADDDLPVASHLGRRGFYLPNGLGSSDEEIEYCAAVAREVLDVG